VSKNITKVIIIGAGRSGTNMLRDLLVQLPNCGTWNCDEINPIWKFGNRERLDDELELKDANEKTCLYINKQFEKVARSNNFDIVVEKTCANSLRVPFVYKVVPEAKFIFITRDGKDVVASSMKRWVSKLDIGYTLKKLSYVPFQDLLFYIWRFGKMRLERMLKKESALSSWGPVYKGMDQDQDRLMLHELCAKQWQKCLNMSIEVMSNIPTDQRMHIQYEDFVLKPSHYLKRIAEFINIENSSSVSFDEICQNVKSSSVGSYKKCLSTSELVEIEQYIKTV
jgi:hypothetical protein